MTDSREAHTHATLVKEHEHLGYPLHEHRWLTLEDARTMFAALPDSGERPGLREVADNAATWLEIEAEHPRADPRLAMRDQAKLLRTALVGTSVGGPTDDELIRLARDVVYGQEQGADEDLPEALTELRRALATPTRDAQPAPDSGERPGLRGRVEAAHPEPAIKDDSRGEPTFWRGVQVGREQVYAALATPTRDAPPAEERLRAALERDPDHAADLLQSALDWVEHGDFYAAVHSIRTIEEPHE
jgi:hypothetical protein